MTTRRLVNGSPRKGAGVRSDGGVTMRSRRIRRLSPQVRWLRRALSRFGWAISERGGSLVEFALVLPVLTLLLVGVIDFGRAYYLNVEVSNAAYTGAMYGTQNNTDTTGMQNAATGDAVDVSGMTATASYGCECSDGSSPVVSCSTQPTCATNVVDYVQVTTSYTYKPMFPWPGIPSSLAMQGFARLRAQ
jgi:Flp pilus assembly protein TadG